MITEYDVAIFGGGPAGLCIEFRLQKYEIEKLFTKTNGDWTALIFKTASLSKKQEQEPIKQNKIRCVKEVDSN